MIKANISEVKNRLSHYLRLVKGGEEIVILDRNTPLARIIHISQSTERETGESWIKEVERTGIVTPPKIDGFSIEYLDHLQTVLAHKKPANVLDALLEERENGR